MSVLKKFSQLSPTDFENAAAQLGCDVAAVLAVCEVEAPKGPFLPSGRATILFEAHIFDRYTKGQYRASHPTISSKSWNQRLYLGGEKEWGRFDAAAALDRTSAQLSISMGAFQIMGFNFKQCGFETVEEFFDAMNASEAAQLAAFVAFIESMSLASALRLRQWDVFARKYNGPGYKQNRYDQKLAQAYANAKLVRPQSNATP